MAYTVDFLDNNQVTAAQLNAIRREAGGEVSADFAANTEYMTSKLNDIRKGILSEGVKTGCGCSLDESGVNIRIGAGACCFGTGMYLEIDAEGVSVPRGSAGTTYVYLYASTAANAAAPVAVQEEKAGAGYVPLCEVSEDGIITDRRSWCQALIPLAASSRVVQTVPEQVYQSPGKSEFVKQTEITLQNKGYSYILARSVTGKFVGYYCKADGKYNGGITGSSGGDWRFDASYFGGSGVMSLKFVEAGERLEIHTYGINGSLKAEFIIV